MTGAIVLAVIILFIVSTFLSSVPVARHIRSIAGKPVRIEVWGQPLPGTVIESIVPLGAGVNLKVSGHPLKIAQPRRVTGSADRLAIAWARYVAWDKQRIPQPPGTTAPAVVFFF